MGCQRSVSKENPSSTQDILNSVGNGSLTSRRLHAALITDPPYYDAVPYAYLSDFFYVWMRRTLAGTTLGYCQMSVSEGGRDRC